MCKKGLEQSVEETGVEKESFIYHPCWFRGLILDEFSEEDEARAEEGHWMPPAGCLLEEDPIAEGREIDIVNFES